MAVLSFLWVASLGPGVIGAAAAADDQRAQGLRPGEMIERAKAAGGTFRTVSPFRVRTKAEAAEPATSSALRAGVVLALDRQVHRLLLGSGTDNLNLALPGITGGTVQLELTRVNIFAPGFSVVASSAPDLALSPEPGLHYWGIVKGDPNSLAAVSVFDDEVMAIYRTAADGAVVLGRLAGDAAGDHVLFAEKDLAATNPFTCHTPDAVSDFGSSPTAEAEPEAGAGATSPAAAAAPCVRVYIEADHDLFLDKGSVEAVEMGHLMGSYHTHNCVWNGNGTAIDSCPGITIGGCPAPGIPPSGGTRHCSSI